MINKIRDKNQSTNQFKFIILLSLLYLTIMLSASSVVHKEISLFGLTTSAAATIFPIWFTLSDIIAEVYGYKFSLRLLSYGMISQFVYVVICLTAIHLPSPSNWHYQSYYDYVFKDILRLYFSVLAGLLISGAANIYLISKWKILLQGRFFWLRSLGASTMGEFVYTAFVSFIVFYNTMPINKLVNYTITSYMLKIIYSLILCYPAAIIANMLKKIEKIDIYDFIPFIMDKNNAPN